MFTCGKFTFSTVVAIVICMSKHTVHVVLCAIALCYVTVTVILLYCIAHVHILRIILATMHVARSGVKLILLDLL